MTIWDKREIVDLYVDGLTISEIAESTGICYHNVHEVLKEYLKI